MIIPLHHTDTIISHPCIPQISHTGGYIDQHVPFPEYKQQILRSVAWQLVSPEDHIEPKEAAGDCMGNPQLSADKVPEQDFDAGCPAAVNEAVTNTAFPQAERYGVDQDVSYKKLGRCAKEPAENHCAVAMA